MIIKLENGYLNLGSDVYIFKIYQFNDKYICIEMLDRTHYIECISDEFVANYCDKAMRDIMQEHPPYEFTLDKFIIVSYDEIVEEEKVIKGFA